MNLRPRGPKPRALAKLSYAPEIETSSYHEVIRLANALPADWRIKAGGVSFGWWIMHEQLRQAVREAAARAEVREAMTSLYARVQGEIEQRRPVCVVSGRCCRFEEYGHRLFVTTMELAAFAHELSVPAKYQGRGCPFQKGKLCGVHTIRPFGCRMFFCDAAATQWVQSQYEHFHAQLKEMHQRLGVPYFYVEWRQGLEAAGSLYLAGGEVYNGKPENET